MSDSFLADERDRPPSDDGTSTTRVVGASTRGAPWRPGSPRRSRSKQLRLNEQLVDALAGRAVIDQAMGVLMGQRLISATDAFGELRARSQHRNVKLRTVAAELIESMTSHAPEPAPIFTDRA